MTFELAKPNQARAIAEIRNAANLVQNPNRNQATAASVRQQIRRAEPDHFTRLTVIVGCQNGTPVCEAGVSTARPNFWKRGLWAEPDAIALGVFGISVHPLFQNSGVGKQLLQFIEICAQERGYRWVRLDAYLENTVSNAFYRSAGYEKRAEISLRGSELVLYEKATPSTDASQ